MISHMRVVITHHLAFIVLPLCLLGYTASMNLSLRIAIVTAAGLALSSSRPSLAVDSVDSAAQPTIHVSDSAEQMHPGPFEPIWESLAHYEAPDWFRDAKFGIWAHWGPQCEPEDGDWYARRMYEEDSPQYKYHLEHYGHPSEFGFKDIIHRWKAENWDPQKLVALYKRAGAQYFFALANHHDNFDLWDSKYQPWNAVNIGPQKDLIAGWAKAARDNGLRFGVSIHAAHAWTWYESAQGADKKGPLAGVAYDGRLTKADGQGQWWEGLDPQDLYAQNHARSERSEDPRVTSSQWSWGNGAMPPDQAYCDKFYNRTIDLINRYHPDLVYFDDTALPLWPVSDAGLKIAAHLYNTSLEAHGGKLEAVLFGKVLTPGQRKCMVWDIERGASNQIEPLAWQTDTCIGDWHYQRNYKSAKTVIQTLVDIVSKNGNLLLNIPVRGDGTIDDDELAIVEQIAKWMDINREAIFGTRPWKICGEGPALAAAAPLSAQGFNEGKGKPLTADDIRFTAKENTIYAIALGTPTKPLSIKSLGADAKLLDRTIADVTLLGSDAKLHWSQSADALTINTPDTNGQAATIAAATVFKVSLTR
jgi:alpha-L-fucosidase